MAKMLSVSTRRLSLVGSATTTIGAIDKTRNQAPRKGGCSIMIHTPHQSGGG
jgi:hypothetical protein